MFLSAPRAAHTFAAAFNRKLFFSQQPSESSKNITIAVAKMALVASLSNTEAVFAPLANAEIILRGGECERADGKICDTRIAYEKNFTIHRRQKLYKYSLLHLFF